MENADEIIQLNSTLKSVRIAFTALFYFDSQKAASLSSRKAVLEFFETFTSKFGNPFESFFIDQTTHDKWTGKKPAQQFSTLKKRLEKPGTHGDYGFFFAKGDGGPRAKAPQPSEFALFAKPISYGRAVCGFSLPVEILDSKKAEITELFFSSSRNLQAEQAFGGFSIVDRAWYYYDGRVENDELRKKEIRELLEKYPGLDCTYTDFNELPWLSVSTEFRKDARARTYGYELKPGTENTLVLKVDPSTVSVKPFEEVWGLRWPSWLTYIGSPWYERLGAASIKEKIEGQGLSVLSLGDGVGILAGPTPRLNKTTELESVARLSSKFRVSPDLNHEFDLVLQKGIFDPKDMYKWIGRFDSK